MEKGWKKEVITEVREDTSGAVEGSKLNEGKVMEKYGITDKMQKFADVFLETGNGALAVREAYWDVKQAASMAYHLKQNSKVLDYIRDSAAECALIQMQMIKSKKTPAAVRNDAIKDRLNRAGIGKEEDEDDWQKYSIGNIIIKIDK